MTVPGQRVGGDVKDEDSNSETKAALQVGGEWQK